MPRYAEVVVDVSAKGVDRPFHYLIDPPMERLVSLGSRVLVPFGKREVEGYVVGFSDSADVDDVKAILGVIDGSPVFTEEQLRLAEWLADHYLCLKIDALQCILPAGTRHRHDIRLVPVSMPDGQHERLTKSEKRLLEALPPGGALVSDLSSVGSRESVMRWAASLEAKGYLTRQAVRKGRAVSSVTKQVVELAQEIAPDLHGLTEKQSAVVSTLSRFRDSHLTTGELIERAGVSASVVSGLLKQGILKKRAVEIRRNPLEHLTRSDALRPLELTPAQAEAVAAIARAMDRDGAKPDVLLHGVTGSGKTEVYIRAAEAAVQRGRQAIILTPEIALTSQVVERFRAVFGDRIAVLHSALSLGERYDEWRRIRGGGASVVIGARSAVFAPLPNLGLIVIDEEHETAYKQDESPRYHARNVARKRAQLTGAVVVLGSATPSIETYYEAEQGLIEKYALPARVHGLEMPVVRIVDMRDELKEGNLTIFSTALREAIPRHIESGGQVILFLNRRGHSTFVLCRECGYVMRCEHCDVALTYHSSRQQLRCHYCDYSVKPPDICPSCNGRYIKYFGIGTERIERQLAEDFPGIEVARLDVDTTRRKHSHRDILERFGSGQARVLVGTQMVAKGLDYPNVSLVGVVSADTSLNIPDFRSAERTFQLISQVAGRAGRSAQGGEVIVQTYCPDHYAVVAAAAYDYEGFYSRELEVRRETGYPPFTRMTSILFHGTSERTVMHGAQRVAALLRDRLSKEDPAVEVLGPSPAPLVKIKDRYRWYLLLKGSDLTAATSLLEKVIEHVVPRLKKVGVMVNITVDPMSMM